jgi:Ca2+-binding RTX toxin-like protein
VTLAALTPLGLAGTVQAAWEPPVQIDSVGEDRGSTFLGEIAVGANGLATIFFFQATDGPDMQLFTRRPADAAGWTAPVSASFATPEGDEGPPAPDSPQPELEANDAGTAGLALRVRRDIPQLAAPPPFEQAEDPRPAMIVTTFGGGWRSDAGVPSPLRQLLGGNDDPALTDKPDVDVDGGSIGHVVAVHDPARRSPQPPPEPAPPADEGPEIYYGQFNTQTGDRIADSAKSDFVLHPSFPTQPEPPDATTPYGPASGPRLDVNEDGDVAISFVARINPQQGDDQQSPPNKLAVFAARRLRGGGWTATHQISHPSERDDVTQHDVAIAPDGTVTVVFAANPAEEGANKIFARRWLTGSGAPRDEERGMEFVSGSEAERPAASSPRVVVDEAGNVTAAWFEGVTQLYSAERTTNWNAPQQLSTAAGSFDLAVDTEGVGTVVYREATNLKGRRRATGTQWAAPDTINSVPLDNSVAPRLDARRPLQADVFFVQANGGLSSGYASRFDGAAPVTPEAPPKPDTEDCPADINLVFGDDGDNSLSGTPERDTVLGGGGSDAMTGGGGDDCLRGGAGNDNVAGEAGNDNVGGGDGDDQLTGNDGDDTLSGGGGNDSVGGNAGNDVGRGGDGNDALDGGPGDDLLSGEGGDDTILGGPDADTIVGLDGNDHLDGGEGVGRMNGGLGNDVLLGGGASDGLDGAAGEDALRGRGGNDFLRGGLESDSLRGGDGKDKLFGNDADDNLFGDAGADLLGGGAGADILRGGGGADQIAGGAGKDRLVGGRGDDLLGGGAHRDRVRGGRGDDRLIPGAGNDRIDGDRGSDRIWAGRGDDLIRAVDQTRDRIDCGRGLDEVIVDRTDRVSRNCEIVTRAKAKRRR